MSRIGKLPIELPQGVTVSLKGRIVSVKGPKGALEQRIPAGIDMTQQGTQVVFQRHDEQRRTRAFHGLARALTANMVTGVSTGFEKRLEIVGVGYKADVEGRTLKLNIGYSHPVRFPIPEGIDIVVEPGNKIIITGIDKQLVGQSAATIRGYRPPDSYKGKGIRYKGERVRIKAGKSAA